MPDDFYNHLTDSDHRSIRMHRLIRNLDPDEAVSVFTSPEVTAAAEMATRRLRQSRAGRESK